MPKPGKGDSGTISGNKRDNILNGTSADDTIDGRQGNDILFGFDGADTLLGGEGNDTLDGGAGNDTVDGGAGIDTAVFSGARDLYTVTDLGGGLIEISGPDGTDTFTGVEFFQFSDMTQTAVEVIAPRLANLAAGTISVDDTVLSPGEGATATFDIASNGVIDAGTTTYELLVATAPDEGAVVAVLDSQTAAALATGASTTLTATIPADSLAPGTYWVAVRVDASDALSEESEADNLTSWVQITVEPTVADFRLSSSVNPASDFELGEGATLQIDYTLENASNTGSGDYRIVSFLSQDGTISADDIQIGETTGTLGLGQTASGTLTGLVDEATQPGDWQVLTRVEWTGGEAEATPADNITSDMVTLNAPVADLRLDGATLGARTDLDLEGGGEIQMTYDYANAGTTTPSYFTIRSYLSTDTTISADDKPILGITGGTVTGRTGSVTTSHYFQDDFAPGDYYIISEISWGDGSADSDPTNNTIIQSVTFTPPPGPAVDLAVVGASIDAGSDFNVENGATIDFTVDVANLGDVSGLYGISAWLSTDGTLDGSDTLLWTDDIGIFTGQTLTFSGSGAIAETVAAGDYKIIFSTNATDSDASNDTFVADITLTAPPPPQQITGTAGNDVITGSAYDDIIDALDGDDLVFATTGNDIVDGGAGHDTIDFSGLATGIQLTPDFYQPNTLLSVDPASWEVAQEYTNFEAIVGTAHDDMVDAMDTDIRFFDLGAGNDRALGTDGNDTFLMGSGNDLVSGGLGDDTVTLGSGADMFGVARYSAGPFPFGHGNDVITDFDTTEDILYFQIENGTTYDPLADATQTAQGTLISYINGSSILLEGVDMTDLSAANFYFEDTIYTFAG